MAIARAILTNPPILILDETTSAVDNETEAAIVRSLEKITKERTTIAISHRPSTKAGGEVMLCRLESRFCWLVHLPHSNTLPGDVGREGCAVSAQCRRAKG